MKIGMKTLLRLMCCMLPLLLATACATADYPDGKSSSIPTATPATDRFQGLNEKQDPVTRVRLGRDVLMPQPIKDDPLPDTTVGPYELRNETLASALQLILDEYDISLAFETDEGLKKKITISNLRGKLGDVVHKVCAVADLYCHYEGGTLTIKKTETFVVDLPPIDAVAAAASAGGGGATSSSSPASGSSGTAATPASSSASSSGSSGGSSGAGSTTNDAYAQIAAGLSAVLAMEGAGASEKPTIDTSTRVLIYSATQRSAKAARQYFERLRKNTALIIFETHIWEVTLDNDNQTGINWGSLATTGLKAATGNFNLTSVLNDTIPAGVGAAVPITITPSYTGGKNFSANFVLSFISEHGTVKTVSQPQITVLSGSKASLAISQQDNYVAGTSTTGVGQVGITPTETLTTGTVNTGLNVNVTSAWDQATVYGAINITLNDLVRIDTFTTPDGGSTVQLPHTTSRSLSTEIRVRPGDSVLIGGLVSQTDAVTASGPGFLQPLFATHRTANKKNTELVFLLKPRVVAFVMGDDSDTPRVVDAPKDGMLPPEPVAAKASDRVSSKVSEAINAPAAATPITPVGKNAVNSKASLPASISPEAFAPQNTPAPAVPEDMPASLQDQAPPLSLTGKPAANGGNKKTGNGYGGVNQ